MGSRENWRCTAIIWDQGPAASVTILCNSSNILFNSSELKCYAAWAIFSAGVNQCSSTDFNRAMTSYTSWESGPCLQMYTQQLLLLAKKKLYIRSHTHTTPPSSPRTHTHFLVKYQEVIHTQNICRFLPFYYLDISGSSRNVCYERIAYGKLYINERKTL